MICRLNTKVKVYNTFIIVGEVSKEALNLFNKDIEMVKFWKKVHEYHNEVDEFIINHWRRKETEPTMM